MTRFPSSRVVCLGVASALCGAFAVACNSSTPVTTPPPGDAAAGNPEAPPTDGPDVEAWLAKGYYKAWQCEPQVHVARSPSPHGFDRVCSNDVVAPNATDPDGGPWPTGAAEVKELYIAVDSDAGPAGYAVSYKVAPDVPGDAGANWYWYERQVDQSIEADGLGTAGSQANAICVTCHIAAGSGPAYTPTDGGRDFIYTPVP